MTRSNQTKQRYPSFSGLLMVDTVRGKVRVRAWPKPRGHPKSAAVRSQNEWFKSANKLLNDIDPGQMKIAIEAAKGTGFYPRDLLMNAMAGGIVEVVFPDGAILTSRQYFLEDVVFQGARIVRDATLSFGANVVQTIPWQSPILQTTPLWSGANPTRLTMPAGITVASFSCGEQTAGSEAGQAAMWLLHSTLGILALNECETAGGDSLSVYSGPIPVIEGDYVEVQAVFGVARSILANSSTFFSCELLEVA